jgi:hypothetical protein
MKISKKTWTKTTGPTTTSLFSPLTSSEPQVSKENLKMKIKTGDGKKKQQLEAATRGNSSCSAGLKTV